MMDFMTSMIAVLIRAHRHCRLSEGACRRQNGASCATTRPRPFASVAPGQGDAFDSDRCSISKKPTPQQVRIIGGQYRRTPIAVVDAEGLRPTPDRVRETLFNWLTHLWDDDFASRRVLDLFAGTGALGLEAASRGAGHVTLVEPDRRALAVLRQVREKLAANQVEIVGDRASAFLARHGGADFDLVFLDPPFGNHWLEKIWPDACGVLSQNGLIYVESESAFEAPAGFTLVRQAKAGAVHYHLLRSVVPDQTN